MKNKADTIDVLLNAGLELFGTYGYNSVTTKHVAEYTGLNSALISYHFGGKEKYYHAVVDYVANLINNWFEDLDIDILESKNPTELKEIIKVTVARFYEWFTSKKGASGTNIFFFEIISQQHPNVHNSLEKAVNFITPYFVNLFEIYYRKTNRSHVNAVFVWIMLISITQNISLHSRAPAEAKDAFIKAEIPQNILTLILNMQ